MSDRNHEPTRAEARDARHAAEAERQHPSRADTKTAAKPRDAAADQLQLLLLLAADWLNGDRTHAGQIQALVVSLSPQLPPSNVDAPFISQSGAVLSCTMGNWTGAPSSYAYQWMIDAGNVGTDTPNYNYAPEEVGKTATCFVSATNSAGTVTGPLSNALVIT